MKGHAHGAKEPVSSRRESHADSRHAAGPVTYHAEGARNGRCVVGRLEHGELNQPEDIHDVSGWNTYWTNHMKVGPVAQALNDMMSSDDRLIELLRVREVRTIFCAGSGLSGEPLALALHGFHVTSLDISTVAVETVARSLRHPEHKVQRIPGLRITGQTFRFGDSGPIAQELCPQVHLTATHPPVAGGSLRLTAGDLTDPAVCPGPFDAVIERRAV